MLLLGLGIILQLLLECLIGEVGRAGDRKSALHRRASRDLLPPFVQVGKRVEIHAAKVGKVNPGEIGNVGDAVFVADEVFVVFEACVEDAVEALTLADVALGGVGDALRCEAVEVVSLALPVGLLALILVW